MELPNSLFITKLKSKLLQSGISIETNNELQAIFGHLSKVPKPKNANVFDIILDYGLPYQQLLFSMKASDCKIMKVS
ncbi:MAG TPA: hypothetical protein VNI52_10460 [Sphingobacteriaceae bacterium]|nr:hypothetical protein [Sphingobacteriaceae bacterium]